jgi:eukaryotic translation initiation factor 2C
MARHRRGRGRRGGHQANPPVDQARDSGGNGRDEANPSGAESGNRNEHRDDDPSRVGQSLPADIRQAGPTLGKEATAPLWKEFEALGIHVRRAEPVFPPRPGYGAEGTPCVVRANRFLGRLVDEGLHQYDVSARALLSSTLRCWF